jgi:hypothetical protein
MLHVVALTAMIQIQMYIPVQLKFAMTGWTIIAMEV